MLVKINIVVHWNCVGLDCVICGLWGTEKASVGLISRWYTYLSGVGTNLGVVLYVLNCIPYWTVRN
jgi:hypothetical protein